MLTGDGRPVNIVVLDNNMGQTVSQVRDARKSAVNASPSMQGARIYGPQARFIRV
jgi:hypothetical protein